MATTPSTDATSPDGMTPSEREQWLRERGVLIETANDRRAAESILASTEEDRPLTIVEQVQRMSLDNADASNEDGIKFVYIPHDTSRPVSTINLPRRLVEALGPAGDIIPTYVKSFFADGKSIDSALMNEQAAKQNLVVGDKSAENNPAAKLTTSAIANATSGGSVETFPLVRPSSTNNGEGVYIYLDEVGLLKHLPANQRASSLALRCGYNPAPKFYGDIFVGRVTSKNFLHNIDIETEDVMDTTTKWMVQATQENLLWQQEINKITNKEGARMPNIAGTEGVAVEVESSDKDKGCSYCWMQNDEEVEITVYLSKKLGEGEKVNKKMVKVIFQMQKVTVKYNGEVMVEVKLYSKLDVDGSTWTLDKNDIVVTGEKLSEGGMWPRLELSV